MNSAAADRLSPTNPVGDAVIPVTALELRKPKIEEYHSKDVAPDPKPPELITAPLLAIAVDA